jgi:hypothetical protein
MASDRPRDRKVGDATLERIDDLAGGWSVKGAERPEPAVEEPAAPEGSSVMRKKRKSLPPPPPPGRKKAVSAPPPPPARSKRPTGPPPPPPGRKKRESEAAELAPVAGEIGTTPAKATPQPIEAAADRAEEATVHTPPGSGEFPSEPGRKKVGNTTGTLRVLPTLPRRRGLLGDIQYVYTAAFGAAGSRRELTAVEKKLAAEKKERDRRLIEVARQALADVKLDSDTLRRGRDEVLDIEEKRSRRAGAIAAADEEIAAIEREREEERASVRRSIDALQREIKSIDEKLEPMERKAQVARRRATRLKENLSNLDKRMAREEAALAGPDGRERSAELEANIASMRAEREQVAGEEPEIASQLDDLEPAIASLTSARADAEAKMQRLDGAEDAAVVRTAEMMTAVKARKAVEERARTDLARDQEDALRSLGELLNVERPADIVPRLKSIEEHELAIATLARRRVELTELVAGIDRWAVVRGSLLILLILGAVAAVVLWLVVP